MPDLPIGPGGSQTTPKQAKRGLKQITSGNFSPAAHGAKKGPNVGGSPNSPCLVSFPSASVPLVGSVGGGCLLSKTAVRAMVGGLLIGLGGTLFIVGGVVLAASGFRKAGGVEKVAGALGSVPTPMTQAAAAGVRAAGRPKQGPSRRQAEAKWMGQVGEPRENTSLREGRGAIRETSRERARRMASASSNGGGDRAPF